MAVTGWKSPTANAVVTTNTQSWANPQNAYTSDATQATAVGTSRTADLHVWNGLGFTTSDIPSGSTIDGIEVEIEHSNQSGGSFDLILQLYDGSATVGSTKAVTTDYSWVVSTLGGAADLWGTTGATLNDVDVRSANFGVTLTATWSGYEGPWVDYLRVRVYYTEGASESELTADDVESSTQLSTPSVSQTHALNSTSVEASSSVTGASFSQTHALAGESVETQSSVTSTSVTQLHVLSTAGVQSVTGLTSPTITISSVDHILLTTSTETETTLSTPSLSQIHSLLAVSTSSTSETSVPTLHEVDVLSAESVESGSVVSNPSVAESYVLSGTSVEAETVLSQPLLSQINILAGSSIEAESIVSIPLLTPIELSIIPSTTVHLIGESRTIFIDGVFQSRTQPADFEHRKVYITL